MHDVRVADCAVVVQIDEVGGLALAAGRRGGAGLAVRDEGIAGRAVAVVVREVVGLALGAGGLVGTLQTVF